MYLVCRLLLLPRSILFPYTTLFRSDCQFANATLGFTFSWGSEFTSCDFSRTRFRDTRWYGSRFVDCTFAGEIKGSEFRSTDDSARVPRRPDMLDGVDLSRTSLVECEFY